MGGSAFFLFFVVCGKSPTNKFYIGIIERDVVRETAVSKRYPKAGTLSRPNFYPLFSDSLRTYTIVRT